MTDTNNLLPLKKFHDELLGSGIDENAVAMVTGKVMRLAEEAAQLKIAAALGEAEYRQLQAIQNQEQQATALSDAYQKKTGQSLTHLLEQMLEKVIGDFNQS